MTARQTSAHFSRLATIAALLTGASLLVSCASRNGPTHRAAAPPRVFLLDAQALLLNRERLRSGDTNAAAALARLKLDAQKSLTAGLVFITDKQVTPPSGDKHDYMSQAPYFWPNPDTTNGLPYIRRDGERNPELDKISDHRSLDQISQLSETLALAWYFTGDEAYAATAAKLLRAFFFDPATRMNPNLEFAQFIPGLNTGRGIGIIESRGLTHVVDAAGLLAGSKSWTTGDQRQLQDWFAQYLKWMQESEHGRAEAAAKNNHGTFYDIQAASFALFLGQTNLAAGMIRAVRDKRIAVQIEPDGRQPLELVRTKAWSYSQGNLDGLMQLARLGECVGVDLWNYQTADGRSIRRAFDYLANFSFGTGKWPYEQLGGLNPRTLYPQARLAAAKYRDSKYQTWLATLPPIDPSNRSNLLH